jgi:hypothetical protein
MLFQFSIQVNHVVHMRIDLHAHYALTNLASILIRRALNVEVTLGFISFNTFFRNNPTLIPAVRIYNAVNRSL